MAWRRYYRSVTALKERTICNSIPQRQSNCFQKKDELIFCERTELCINEEYLNEVHEVTHLGHKLSSVIGDSTAAFGGQCQKFYALLCSVQGSVKGAGTNPIEWNQITYFILLPY